MEEKEKNRQYVTLESRVKRQKNLLAMAGYGMFLTGFLSAAFVIFTCTDFSVYGKSAFPPGQKCGNRQNKPKKGRNSSFFNGGYYVCKPFYYVSAVYCVSYE